MTILILGWYEISEKNMQSLSNTFTFQDLKLWKRLACNLGLVE
jgi:hypothetical protein